MSIKNEWTDQMWSISAEEYYSSIKRNEAQIQAPTGMQPKDIIPGEGSQM